jgi:stage V sporulation protein S
MMELLKVATLSKSTAVAGAIAGTIRDGHVAELQAIGAGAVNQMVKAVVIARSFLTGNGIDIVCFPTFVELVIDGHERTAVRIIVQRPDQPIPRVPALPPKSERPIGANNDDERRHDSA